MSEVQVGWNKMYNKFTFTNDSESCCDNYDEFSKSYEEVSSTLGFSLPKFIADLLFNEVPSSVFEDPNATMMDVAAGTGLIADGLRRHGFAGIIDGIDGSLEMMNVAQKKGHYRSLVKHILMPGKIMPVMDNSYDILTCVAALSTGHIQSCMIPDMLRTVKTGGHMIFTVRDNITACEYVAELKELIKQMEVDGKWRQVSMTRAEQYAVNCATPTDPTGQTEHKDNGPMYSLVYHYIKC